MRVKLIAHHNNKRCAALAGGTRLLYTSIYLQVHANYAPWYPYFVFPQEPQMHSSTAQQRAWLNELKLQYTMSCRMHGYFYAMVPGRTLYTCEGVVPMLIVYSSTYDIVC